MPKTKQTNDINIPVAGKITLIIIAYFFVVGAAQLIGFMAAGIHSYSRIVIENISLYQMFILQIFTLSALVFLIYIFRKYLDRKTIISLGLSFKNKKQDLFYGFVMAFFIIGSGFLALYLSGYISILHIQINLSDFLLSFIILVMAAFEEEIFVRGYILNNLLTVTNKYVALIISSAIFALFHILNSDISYLSMASLFLAGILLGYSYLFTNNLWFPISLHLFWNFFQGPVFGFHVSGQSFPSILLIRDIGNPLINGGKFGFEGSVICILTEIISIFFLITYFEFFRLKKADYHKKK